MWISLKLKTGCTNVCMYTEHERKYICAIFNIATYVYEERRTKIASTNFDSESRNSRMKVLTYKIKCIKYKKE